MPAPLTASIPIGLDLPDGYIIRFTAINAADGTTVANVVVSDVTIEAESVSGGTPLTSPGAATKQFLAGE